jgi:hypothetical protein
MRRSVVFFTLTALLISACAQPSPDAAISPAPPPVPEAPPEAVPVEAPEAPAAAEEPASPEAPAAPDACASLDAETCAATPGCSTIRGLSAEDIERIKRPDPAFSGAPGSILGCTSAEQGCKEVETMAAAGPGEPCYLFGDSCVPEGWVTCKMEISLE